MTEYNLFCFAKEYNDKDSFQQKRWRVFNQEVGEERYKEILKEVKEIMGDFKLKLKESDWEKEWKKLDTNKIQKLSEIKEFDWAIFTAITGIEKVDSGKDIITVDGVKYKKIT